ncbi:hypothetical protein A1Q1_07325 [Trichosporon asahii var. asahii CBS 2479]|uniref:Uncharacterized protein n=1 Tax=Trichosporon asahii var. asahii (strain ATCC 90039 / CBS 2479 / JCM 2466 / KCTC 7840 / NBRC 103889/ NCYC 2677 / UAMH 7654) TaxID=1186058 RepID=J5R942_TRIAS|nr:hypothetical protein A1Q1_07325 [Trichosporon asahii var. asahii CBS 2479]EJT51353.1 hypothetical protein A1Q1_07325 [Trichosporon asahii var. asahii CBS 2479]
MSVALDLPGALRTLPSALLNMELSDPLHLPLLIVSFVSGTSYALGLATGNVGWVDRVYTTLPLFVSAAILLWAHTHGFAASVPRLAVILFVQCIWSARLTYHTARRGLYKLSGEDYRYVWLRQRVPPWFFQMVHLFAVVLLQPILIGALSFPLVGLLREESELAKGKAGIPAWLFGGGDGTALHAGDIAFLFVSLACVILEAAADEAMFTFQEGKHAALKQEKAAVVDRELRSQLLSVEDNSNGSAIIDTPQTEEPEALYTPAYYPGFPTRGLHSLVRHPNFLGEQLFHLSIGLWPLCANPTLYAASCLLPALALSLLFTGSTLLTETITASKYPLYREYQKVLGKFAIQETLLKLVYFEFFRQKDKERIEGLLYPREVAHIGVLRRISSSSVSTASSSSRSSAGISRFKEE